jgi:cytochrome b561
MIDQEFNRPVQRHPLGTRIAHFFFAIAIVTQLATSLIMRAPHPGRSTADTLFRIHEYFGLAALALAAIFWISIVIRQAGTDFGALIPWFSGRRVHALWTDIKTHAILLRDLRWPQNVASPLANAVHGLGLLLMSLMAVTGTIVYATMAGDGSLSTLGSTALDIHKLFANLAWAYLIGHAGIAVLHQAFGAPVISEMWSLRPERSGTSKRAQQSRQL